MAYDFTRPSTREYTCIEVTQPQEGVKVITLNRPDSLNAISIELAHDLEDALQELKFDNKTRVVILTGAGRGFCAGTDLKEMAEFNAAPDLNRNLWLLQKHMASIVELLRTIPQPVNAAMDGASMNVTLGFENRNQYICGSMGTFAAGSSNFAKKHS